jgi:hypothetical protein
MIDLIDLANLVFDELLKKHGEEPSGRELFLYTMTLNQRFYLINSNKTIHISSSGISKNFDDFEIDKLNIQWQEQLQSNKEKLATEFLKRIKSEQTTPKDGDTFNFWNNETAWREIKL